MKSVGDIFEFSLFPYGNAHQQKKRDGTWEFTCQHGATECLGNTIEACAMHYHNSSQTEWFPFILCMEEEGSYTPRSTNKCAKESGWTDGEAINKCAKGPLGNSLLHEVGVATETLNPPHTYTPWVVINGKPVPEDDPDSLIINICKHYTGVKPAVCNKQRCARSNVSAPQLETN